MVVAFTSSILLDKTAPSIEAMDRYTRVYNITCLTPNKKKDSDFSRLLILSSPLCSSWGKQRLLAGTSYGSVLVLQLVDDTDTSPAQVHYDFDLDCNFSIQ